MRFFKATTLFFLLFAVNEAVSSNDCARCRKIESERASEQAAHPQQMQYYDEYLKMHPSLEKENAVTPDTTIAITDKSEDAAYSNWMKKVESEGLSNPGMDQENQAAEKALTKKKELQTENQDMIQRDHALFEKGYDPNQGYGGFKNPNLNQKYPDQEKQLRGE